MKNIMDYGLLDFLNSPIPHPLDIAVPDWKLPMEIAVRLSDQETMDGKFLSASSNEEALFPFIARLRKAGIPASAHLFKFPEYNYGGYPGLSGNITIHEEYRVRVECGELSFSKEPDSFCILIRWVLKT